MNVLNIRLPLWTQPDSMYVAFEHTLAAPFFFLHLEWQVDASKQKMRQQRFYYVTIGYLM